MQGPRPNIVQVLIHKFEVICATREHHRDRSHLLTHSAFHPNVAVQFTKPVSVFIWSTAFTEGFPFVWKNRFSAGKLNGAVMERTGPFDFPPEQPVFPYK